MIPATITFDMVSDSELRYRMRGARATETGAWVWARDREPGVGTLVRHEFVHTGLLLRVMAPAFAPVARWRLERLSDEVQRRFGNTRHPRS